MKKLRRFIHMLILVAVLCGSCSGETYAPGRESITGETESRPPVVSTPEMPEAPAEGSPDKPTEPDATVPGRPEDDITDAPFDETEPGETEEPVTQEPVVSPLKSVVLTAPVEILPGIVYDPEVPEGHEAWIFISAVLPDGDDHEGVYETVTVEVSGDEEKAVSGISFPYCGEDGKICWNGIPYVDGSSRNGQECFRDVKNHIIYMTDEGCSEGLRAGALEVLDALYGSEYGWLMPPDSTGKALDACGLTSAPSILYRMNGEGWMIAVITDFGAGEENTIGMFSPMCFYRGSCPVIFINARAFGELKAETVNMFAGTVMHEYTHFLEAWKRRGTNGTADVRAHLLSEGFADYVAATSRGIALAPSEADYIWFWLNEGTAWTPESDETDEFGNPLYLMNYGLGAMIHARLDAVYGGFPATMIDDSSSGLHPLENATGMEAGDFIDAMFRDMIDATGAAGADERRGSWLSSFRFRELFSLYGEQSSSLPERSTIKFSHTGAGFFRLPANPSGLRVEGNVRCTLFAVPEENRDL